MMCPLTDAEEADVHEVYACFGLAIYHAQCLERQLALIVLALAKLDPKTTTRETVEQLLEHVFGQTMGRTVREVERRTGLPDDLEERIREALRLRNWLAHDYFWERAAHLASSEGRSVMRKELDCASRTFDDLDSQLVLISREWSHSVGVTDEQLERELRQLLDRPLAT